MHKKGTSKNILLEGNNQDDTSPSRINKFKKAYVEKKFVQVEKACSESICLKINCE